MSTWRERLAAKIPPDVAEEIDIYSTQIELKRQSKLDDKIFAETRLRRGAYGQRYDNGQRNDGTGPKELKFPSDPLTKGPETIWDAPGMQRIKLPWGGVTPQQMDVLADLAEEYSDGICHITTRQDIQLHYVHIDDTPDLMRRLAAVGITTREACGNSVRNVTACPIAGVCRAETFDVTPYAEALMRFLLGHPDCQDFGRKFKIAFSGCAESACGLANMHDMGFIASRQVDADGRERRGFAVYVGGGLGTVPYQAKLFDPFVPEEEILPLAQATARVFARLGEKRNRARARIKFLIAKLGIDKFRHLVLEERRILPEDERWNGHLGKLPHYAERPLRPAVALDGAPRPHGFDAWLATNVYAQRQPGYAVATVTCPLGDLTSTQMRRIGEIARRYVGDSIRTTVEQNVVLRWVSEGDLPALYRELAAIGLGAPGAGTILDVVSCPGTDTCKLGIASSRGLARELSLRLAVKQSELDEAVKGLRIKVSGCFNSCGQHHVADLGFYGVSRKVAGATVPHFQVVLGGKWEENAGAYGLAIGAVPSKRIPDVVSRITERYVAERGKGESFQGFIRRLGKVAAKDMLEELAKVPAYEEDRSYYSDWGDPREFTVGDMGKGECAGEVVSQIEFDLAAAERLAFEAQVWLDRGDYERADDLAYRAMLAAARGLVKLEFRDVPAESDRVVEEFRRRFYDTELFFDRFAGGKFAHYLFRRHDRLDREYGEEVTHRLVEEAQLFLEAAHACHGRLLERNAGAAAAAAPLAVEVAPAAD